MRSTQEATPQVRHALATPRYVREHMIMCGRTKFWALVKAGKIRMVDVGVGRKMVDVASIDALTTPQREAA